MGLTDMTQDNFWTGSRNPDKICYCACNSTKHLGLGNCIALSLWQAPNLLLYPILHTSVYLKYFVSQTVYWELSVPADSFWRALAKKLKAHISFCGTVCEVPHPIPILFLITKLVLSYPSFPSPPRRMPHRILPSAQFAYKQPPISYPELLRPNGQSPFHISVRSESHFSCVSPTRTESSHCRSHYAVLPR